eukprot:PITA_12981
MSNLEILSIDDPSLEALPHSFGVCPVLKYLDLTCCGDLVEVGALPTTLIHLNLWDFHALKKITGLRGLAKFKQLFMIGCKAIEELPGLAELNSLENLYLCECPLSVVVPFFSVEKVQEGRRLLDSSIDRCMPRLQYLDLSKARITEISFCKGVCPVLKALNLSDCNDLVEVGALLTALTSLALRDCYALKKITGLHGVAKLQYLDMDGCEVIEELPDLAELNNLEVLNLRECPISAVMPFSSVEKVQGGRRLLDSSIDNRMLRLKYLNLNQAKITEISFGEGVCPALEQLDFSDCKNLVEVGVGVFSGKIPKTN